MVSSTLALWMNGELVGHWRLQRGSSTLTCARSWLESDKVRSLSLSLPITASREIRGQVVTNFFDNLLPDNDRIRERLARRFRTRGADAFALLEAIGRDCVGAVQLLPEGTAPAGWNRVDAEPLTDDDVGRILDAVPAETALGMGADDDLFRISLAGAQEKTALADFCQALGYPPAMKNEKDGGPGMEACLKLLAGSAAADEDRRTFLLAQLASWLMAATDGHAKNYSIFLAQGDAYRMTPLYDVLSVWPYLGDAPNQFRGRSAGLAMALRSRNAHYALHAIQTRHWAGLAMKNGGEPVWHAMRRLADEVEPALASVEARLPADFPGRTWETIAAGMRAQAQRFREGVAGMPAGR